MAGPIITFVVCFGAGFWASIRWLPELEAGPVGTFAGFAVAILFGAALALVGLELYDMAHDLRNVSRGPNDFPGSTKGQIISSSLPGAWYNGGTVAGLACIAYLLAPRLYPDRVR